MLLSIGPMEGEGTHLPPHEEWKLSVPLLSALEELVLQDGTGQCEAMVRLKPHLEEALKTLTRLEQQRGLSNNERLLGESIRVLLAEIKEVE